MRATRRAALGLAAGVPLAACAATEEPADEPMDEPTPELTPEPSDQPTEEPRVDRITYGDDPSQWVDLHEPEGESRGLVVVIHGGFWKAQYGADYGAPLAADLAARGWTAANIEYRRVGNGGGYPRTLDDVHAAIGTAASAGWAEGAPLVTLGHSAGGHLATWAGARRRFDRWADGPDLTHVVSQAGVLDLRAAVRKHLGTDAALAFLGDTRDATFERADPMTQVPLDVPVWAVHAKDDDTVPFNQAKRYVEAANAAGAEATLVKVAGGHFGVIDPASEAWAACVAVLDAISA